MKVLSKDAEGFITYLSKPNAKGYRRVHKVKFHQQTESSIKIKLVKSKLDDKTVAALMM